MGFQFVWTEELSVGNAVLDREHERLLGQVNILVNAIGAQNDPAVVQSVIEFLNTYITDHFSHEERYMMDNDYPDVEAHIALHREFTRQYDDGLHYRRIILRADGIDEDIHLPEKPFMLPIEHRISDRQFFRPNELKSHMSSAP
jgi:hemerythrin-like metal-binding protein